MGRLGLILTIFGLIYIIKPDLYRRWFWKKTDILQKTLKPENYIKVMRILGVAFLIAGIVQMIVGKFKLS